jgi:2,5-diamino-6-(ribosylamino)-4(3H)-pyrimidinone 5'-phosphate reductase
MNRPETTLFMLMSVDGKISTGDTDIMDIDTDLKKINGVREGNQQYYDLEQRTDLYSLNSGRVFEKIGINEKNEEPEKGEVSFIVIDNKPHLNKNGTIYLSKKSKTLFIITTNFQHPAFELKEEFPNIEILKYEDRIDLGDLLKRFKQEYGIERITIQSGGTLNTSWVREGLIDHVSVVVAPVLIGGKDTSTLMDGESLHTPEELLKIKALKLVKCDVLNDSYIHLQYDVINEKVI